MDLFVDFSYNQSIQISIAVHFLEKIDDNGIQVYMYFAFIVGISG
jgi:hypothetical protein